MSQFDGRSGLAAPPKGEPLGKFMSSPTVRRQDVTHDLMVIWIEAIEFPCSSHGNTALSV